MEENNTFYVVRANGYWYKFDYIEDAMKHYEYIFNNKDSKYKNVDKIYIAEYEENKTPKIIKIWNRPKEGEIND